MPCGRSIVGSSRSVYIVMKTSARFGRTTLASSDGHVFSRVRTKPVTNTANCGRPRAAPAPAALLHGVDPTAAASTTACASARAIAMASCSSAFAFDSALFAGRRGCFFGLGCGGVRLGLGLRVRTAIPSAVASPPALRTTKSVSCTLHMWVPRLGTCRTLPE
eukprot:1451918-Prymnesium_polylepis.1